MADQPDPFDVVIIGGAWRLRRRPYGAGLGWDIAMVEMAKVGGTCLHRGCIPAKELLETASVFRSASEAAQFGITTSEPAPRLLGHPDPQAGRGRPAHQGPREGLLKAARSPPTTASGTPARRPRGARSGGESGDVVPRGDAGSWPRSTTRTIPGLTWTARWS